MNDEDKLSTLLRLAGRTEEGMHRIDKSIDEVKLQMKELNGSAIRRAECTETRKLAQKEARALENTVKRRLDDIKRRIPTSREMQSVSTAKAESQGAKVKHWVTTVGGVLGILALVGGGFLGLVKAGRYLEQVDHTIKAVEKQQVGIKQALKDHQYNMAAVRTKAVPLYPRRPADPPFSLKLDAGP